MTETDERKNVSDAALEKELQELTKNNPKEAAVRAFALAKRALAEKDDIAAGHFGKRCIELLERCPTRTLEDCVTPHVLYAGVLIPGLFHEGTVRRELKPLVL